MQKGIRLLAMLMVILLMTVSGWAESVKPRLIVMADMGNEPDEEQQILHLLMCSNEIELEGLLAVSGAALHSTKKEPERSRLHPELHHRLIDGYAQIYPNLRLHAEGWHSPEYLRSIVATGRAELGMTGVGDGMTSEGSELIIKQVTKDDPRPIFIVANAGSSTLAQALYDYRKTHTPDDVAAFVAKLRVYENAAQDNAGAWINHEFPEIHWIRSIHQTKCWGGPLTDVLGPHNWKPYAYTAKGQDNWAKEHIRTNHGPLGELYPIRAYSKYTDEAPNFIEGGGTIPWLMLTRPGHTDPNETSWGSWSGRYTIEKAEDVPARWGSVVRAENKYRPWAVYTDAEGRWTDPETGKEYNDVHASVWPWRQAMWNDLQARMDWCVKPYNEANHHPVAALDGDTSDAIVKKTLKVGETIAFDTSASTDPDGDALRYHWWIYSEAGRKPYGKDLKIQNADQSKVALIVPDDAAGKELHLILEVWDKSKIVPLVDYRRVVLTIHSDRLHREGREL